MACELFGDVPFMVDLHSADVWTHQEQFELDRSVGVPPDAFSATGQDWGMPPYNWDAFAKSGFVWLHDRARRSAALYDGYRVDHLVGFYRTYSRPRAGEGEPVFSPVEEDDQLALGEQVLAIFREAGSEIIAEDLGTVLTSSARHSTTSASPDSASFAGSANGMRKGCRSTTRSTTRACRSPPPAPTIPSR